jgi:hypothetical protein
LNAEPSRAILPHLLSTEEVRALLQYRSRSAFHELLSKDTALQACAMRVGRRILWDAGRLARYLDRRRLTRLHDGE